MTTSPATAAAPPAAAPPRASTPPAAAPATTAPPTTASAAQPQAAAPSTTAPATAAPLAPTPPPAAPPAPPAADDGGCTVVVARTVDEVPRELPPGLVVVLPGGFRMWSGPRPEPPPVAAVTPPVAPPRVVPPDAGATRDRATALARLVTEVLILRRTPSQLTAVASPGVLRYLAVAVSQVSRAARGGGRAATGGQRAAPGGPGRVHVRQPHPDAAEVCTTVRVAGRPRALALRLDRRAAGAPWTVTAVRLL